VNADPSIAALPAASAAEYARQARRLRARFSDQPGRLHQALRDLPVSAPAIAVPQTPADQFAQIVAASMEAGLLRYSTRLTLLRKAMAMGIDRFAANLIIATVQNSTPASSQSAGRGNRSGRLRIPWTLITILLGETLILYAIWRLVFA
jgi:hypothetical protein